MIFKIMWVVVHFLEENSVELVPESWYENGYCWWPTNIQSSKISKLVEKEVKKNENDGYEWNQIEARKLGKCFDSLADAKKGRAKAELLSDFTDSSPGGKGKRQKYSIIQFSPETIVPNKKERKGAADSTSTSSCETPMPSPMAATRKSPRKAPNVGSLAGCSQSRNVPAKEVEGRKCLTSPKKKEQAKKKLFAQAKPPRSQSSLHQIDTRTVTNISFIRATLNRHTEMLQLQGEAISEILVKLDSPAGRTNLVDGTEPQKEFDLPMTTKESVINMEETLKDPAESSRLVVHLSRLGGSNVGDVTKRILRTLLTNSAASEFSWLGLKKKSVFSTLQLKTVIYSAVRNNKNVATATDKEIEEIIKVWLRAAKFRSQSETKNAAAAAAQPE